MVLTGGNKAMHGGRQRVRSMIVRCMSGVAQHDIDGLSALTRVVLETF